MRKTARYVIQSQKQLAALACAARQEIVDVLAELGAVSVAELAATLGRPADALYFHLRRLTQVGLVRQAGYRVSGGRKEALYRTVATELMLQYEPQEPSNRKAVSAIVASMLRLGIRDFGRAFQRGNVIVSGPQRELWAQRHTGRLSLAQIAGVNRSIGRLKNAVSNPRQRGRLYAVTILLTPLDRHPASDAAAKPKRKRMG
jgi:DNA-binding transcriptional ArsR family regulator